MLFSRITPWDLLQKAIPRTEVDDVRFEVPVISKAHDETKRRYLKGVASTPTKDLQDETVVQKGMDLRYFLQYGFLNDDHKPGPENKVGEPTHAEIKQVKDSGGNSLTGMWLEGFLWPEGAHEGADHIWTLAKALKKADSNRKMGFSIQGKVLRREGSKIIKAWIQDVAVTISPVNTGTWLELVEDIDKSLIRTVEEKDFLFKSISTPICDSEEMIEELENKALSAGYGSAIGTESLEESLKVQLYSSRTPSRKDPATGEIRKSLTVASPFDYEQAIIKGYIYARRKGSNRQEALQIAFGAAARYAARMYL